MTPPYDSQRAATRLLVQVTLEASRGDTLDEILRRIVDCIVEHEPITIASIILLNDRCSHFVQEVFAGPMDLMRPAEGLWPVTLGVSGRCARSGQPQLVTAVHEDPDYVPGNAAVRSEYLVPIRHRERLLGVLNLESTLENFFTAEVCTLFTAVARQIAGTIYSARVVRELEQANHELQQMSRCDGLTGIANRRCFDNSLEQTWKAHAVDARSLALVLLDIDLFKALNDSRGHVFADDCLRDVARECAASARRDDDLVARYGGEEFVILLPACDVLEARRVAELLRQRVEALGIPHPASTVADCLTVSAGVAALRPRAAARPESLVERADYAMYAAKRQGRNRVVVAD